jgi:glucose/mannose-6-phosphate isomerase
MSDSFLDAPETYARLDPEGILTRIIALPDQFAEAWDAGARLALPRDYADVDRVVAIGMGGSGIGSALLQALALAMESSVPVFCVRGYTLPAFVDGRSLVLASSHSGNTEETLAATGEAIAAGARCVAITSGGVLLEMARANGVPALAYSWAGEPRSALGWSFAVLAAICCGLGLLPALDEARVQTVESMRGVVEQCTRALDEQANPAKRLARRLAGRLPVFVGAEALAAVAYRWRTQVNENAKSWAIADELPEMNHNAQAGYGLPRQVVPLLHAVFLRHETIHPRLRLRIDATADEMRRAGVSAEVLQVPGRHVLVEMMYAVQFGDFVSFYLGLLNEVHPALTPALASLKTYMAARPA